MKIEKRLLVVEIVGLAAVAASLVFVGFQMKQTQEIAQAMMRLEITQGTRDLMGDLLEFPETIAIMSGQRAAADGDEQVRTEIMARAVYRGYENYFYQHRSGFLEDSEWRDGTREEIAQAMRLPFNRAFWPEVRHGYSPAFRRFVDEVVDEPAEED